MTTSKVNDEHTRTKSTDIVQVYLLLRCYKKKKHAKFSEKRKFLTPWYTHVRIGGQKMFVFRKIWRALFSCNTRFEIRPFALLPPILWTTFPLNIDVILCAIWYHLHNLKNVRNTHGGVLLSYYLTFNYFRRALRLRSLVGFSPLLLRYCYVLCFWCLILF